MGIPYIKIYPSDMVALTSCLKGSEKLAIYEAIEHFGMFQKWPEISKKLQNSEKFLEVFELVREKILQETEKYLEKKEKMRTNAKTRWYSEKPHAKAMQLHSKSVPNENAKALYAHKNQEPVTNNQEPNSIKQVNAIKTTFTETAVSGAEPESPFLPEAVAVAVEPEPPDPDAGTFRAEPKTNMQRLGGWFVFRYFDSLFASAGPKATTAWFKRNGKALSEILALCDGDVELAKAVVLETEAQMGQFEKRKGEVVQWGLEAVARNFADNFGAAKKRLENGEVKNA